MKKQIFVLGFLIFLLSVVSPVWALFCPKCGVKVLDDAKFCHQCGNTLPSTQLESVVTAEPAVPAQTVSEKPGSNVLSSPPAPQAFQVNSHYLLVNGYRIPKKSLFWVAEVRGNNARVWCVSEYITFGIVMGWVSIAELEKRTTLKLDAGIQCVEPPPPAAKIVVIKSQPYWREWYPRPFSYKRHRKGRHHRR